ncbi:GHKL domain-containing protein [Companilactobacillus zhachilii]|uniref:GHKL domain-containing protein n=2 Tax=Companilactobacillus zhachilii TaxID=2304606 RepID=A0A386PSF8_9LACO|nr:GHKL domain-containing protein [Companilactobacillus zhachilii]
MNPIILVPFIFIMYLLLKEKGQKDYFLLNTIITSFLINILSDIISSSIISIFYKSNKGDAFIVIIELISVFIITLLLNLVLIKSPILRIIKSAKTPTFSIIEIYFYTVTISFIYFIQKFKAYTTLISGILLFLIIQAIIVIYFYLYTTKHQQAKFEKKLMLEQLDNLSQYTKQLDKDQKEMHKFKHDFKNILSSLNTIALSNDNPNLKKSLTELEGYSSQYFSNISMDDFKDLEYISNIYIKSLLISKLKTIKANGITCYFECKNDISHIDLNIFDLIRILGVSIDNAIEETAHQANGKIQIILINKNNQIDIIIKNTITKSIPINQIQQYGFSTKKKHEGLGMVNIQDIKQKYRNLLIHYNVLDKWFYTQISIINKGVIK